MGKHKQKRANGAGSVYQRSSDGKWVGALSLPDGRRRTVTAGSRKDALDRLAALRGNIADGLDTDTPNITVGAFLTRWLADGAKPSVRARTYEGYAQMVRLHLTPTLGKCRLADLTPGHVQRLLSAKSAAGLSPRTVQCIRAVLCRALGQAVKWGLATRNVAALTDAPRQTHDERRPLTPEQVRALLDAAVGHRLGALLHVAVGLGLRQGELLALRWTDVDLDGGTLHVRRALTRIQGVPTFTEPKTKRSRRGVPLPSSLVAVLRAHQERQAEARGLAGPNWQDQDLLFCNELGGPLTGTCVTKSFQRICVHAGVPVVRFHDLRHTAATLMLMGGVPDRVVQDVFGWSSGAMLSKYQHVMSDMKRSAVQTVADLLQPPKTAPVAIVVADRLGDRSVN